MRHLVIVAALLLLAVAVQAVVVGRSVVPALDAGRFLVAAEWMDREGALAAVRSQSEQPLYSIWVCAVRRVLRAVWGDFPSLGAAVVQLAAAVPLVLVVVPVYFVSLRLYGPTAAVAGASLFSILPEVARLGADGISDSTHLLFLALAFWAVLAFLTGPGGRAAMADFRNPGADPHGGDLGRLGSPWLLLLAGLATGLAVLTRAEVLVLPAAMAIGGLVSMAFRESRRRIGGLAVGAGYYVLGLAAVLVPYLGVTGAAKPQAAMARVLGRPGPQLVSAVPTAAPTAAGIWHLPDGRPMCFAAKEAGSTRHRGLGRSLRSLGGELCEAFWYWVGLLGIYALWAVRRLRARPVDWFVRLFLTLYCTAALAFAAQEGYLEARHLVPLLVSGIGCCGFGAVEAGLQLAALKRDPKMLQLLAPVLVVGLAGAGCLGQTLLPVGHAAAAHRAAADWLAGQPNPGTVVDTKGWSRLYSGRKTFQYADGPAGFADPGLAYVVVEPWELKGASPRSQTLARLLAVAGQRVAEFSGAGGEVSRGVAVYRWRPERLGEQDGEPIVTDAERVHDARTSASLRPERRGGV